MNNAMEVKIYEFLAGTSIEEACEEAVEIAKRNNCIVKFSFNGVAMKVYGFSDKQDKVEEYMSTLSLEKKPKDKKEG